MLCAIWNFVIYAFWFVYKCILAIFIALTKVSSAGRNDFQGHSKWQDATQWEISLCFITFIFYNETELAGSTTYLNCCVQENSLGIAWLWAVGFSLLFTAASAASVVVSINKKLSSRRGTARRAISVRYDTRCYFNVRSKANMSQLNLPHGTDN